MESFYVLILFLFFLYAYVKNMNTPFRFDLPFSNLTCFKSLGKLNHLIRRTVSWENIDMLSCLKKERLITAHR